MNNIKKYILWLLFIFCLIEACTYSENGNNENIELTKEQQLAFNALNQLQISMDTKNKLYSTFANIAQPCYPADTSFEISQAELQLAMQQFLAIHATKLKTEYINELAQLSVKAQKKYTVLHCIAHKGKQKSANNGTWILPNILGRRDLIMVW